MNTETPRPTACYDHGATTRSDGTCMVRGCRFGTPPPKRAAETSGGGGLTEAERETLFTRPRELNVKRDTAALEAVVERIIADRIGTWIDPATHERSLDLLYEQGVDHGRVQARAEVVARVEAVLVRWNTCTGCFADDHPCGDPKCDLWRDVRAALAGPNPRGGQDGGGE